MSELVLSPDGKYMWINSEWKLLDEKSPISPDGKFIWINSEWMILPEYYANKQPIHEVDTISPKPDVVVQDSNRWAVEESRSLQVEDKEINLILGIPCAVLALFMLIFALVDLIGSYIGFDLWVSMGFNLPGWLWSVSSIIEFAIAAIFGAIGGELLGFKEFEE